MKKLFKKISLKYVYTFSFFGVALIACSIVGLLLYFTSTRELLLANERQIIEKMECYANYLEIQQEIMADIANDISVKIYYKKFYYERNAYYELELLKEFVKYKNNSMIVDDYFLLYRNSDWVFRSTGNKYDFDILMKVYGLNNESERLYNTFNDVQEFSIVLCQNPSIMMFAFPVHNSGKNNEIEAGTIVFIISAERLQERLEALIGNVKGNIYLFWDDIYLMSLNTTEVPVKNLFLQGQLLEEKLHTRENKCTYYIAKPKTSMFSLMLHTPPDFTFENLERFSFVNTLYIVIATLLLLAISILLGHYNYLPIKRLISKYFNSSLKNKEKNEIHNVEFFLDSIMREKEEAEISLEKYYRIIKQQILNLVLDGNSRYIQLVSKPFMGIHLEGPIFYIMTIRLKMPLNNEMEQNISEQIEELSENGIQFHFISTQYENYCAVIISAPAESDHENAIERIQMLLHDKLECQINVSEPFYRLQKAQDYFIMDVKLQKLEEKVKILKKDIHMDYFEFYKRDFERVILAIHDGNYKSASCLFRLFIDKTKKQVVDSFTLEQFIFYNALYKMIMFAKKQEISIEASLLKPILETWDRPSIMVQFDRLIYYICKSIDGEKYYDKAVPADNKKNEYAEDLISFIDNNYHNPDMSLDLLSEKYKLSTRYISNIIKEYTGLSYKEYLTNLRIQKAQELLLTQDMTVAEVCESVGYVHLSHFISTFKNITGFTPSHLKLANYITMDKQPLNRN